MDKKFTFILTKAERLGNTQKYSPK